VHKISDDKIIRIPKDVLPYFNKYKSRLESELTSKEDRTSTGKLKDSAVIRHILLDYDRHDVFLLLSNLEKFFAKFNMIEEQLNSINSKVITLTLKKT
jgi:hypothetical protein